jgi:hypothetical protein
MKHLVLLSLVMFLCLGTIAFGESPGSRDGAAVGLNVYASAGNPQAPVDPVVFGSGGLVDPAVTTITVPAGPVTIAPQLNLSSPGDVTAVLMYLWMPQVNFGIDLSAAATRNYSSGVLTISLGTIDFSCYPGTYDIYYGYVDQTGVIHYQAYRLVVQPFSLPASVIVTGDYGAAFYLVDATTGTEVFSRKLGFLSVRDVTINHDGTKIYFAGKETGTGNDELYSYNLPCDDQPVKLTSFGTFATQNPDASPVSDAIVLEALAGEGTAKLYLVTPGGDPVKISGDEQLVVEGADDPTVSWGDKYPAWSPDGGKIAYARYCKDKIGPNTAEIRAIVTMNADGSDKQVVYADQDGKNVENVCWSYDGNFIFFTLFALADSGNRQVMGLHLASGTLSNVSSGFVQGGNPDSNSLRSSPTDLEIVYTPHVVNPDLYKITLDVNDNHHLSVLSSTKLTDGKHYRNPDWR